MQLRRLDELQYSPATVAQQTALLARFHLVWSWTPRPSPGTGSEGGPTGQLSGIDRTGGRDADRRRIPDGRVVRQPVEAAVVLQVVHRAPVGTIDDRVPLLVAQLLGDGGVAAGLPRCRQLQGRARSGVGAGPVRQLRHAAGIIEDEEDVRFDHRGRLGQ
jgi:hypothetical protein